jgi:hypothetical protein
LSSKIKRKEDKLKQSTYKLTKIIIVNKENLKLMERINELEKKEKIGRMNQTEFKANESSLEEKNKISSLYDNSGFDHTMNMNNKTAISKFKYSEYGKDIHNSSVLNITEAVEEDKDIREHYESYNSLKKEVDDLAKTNQKLSGKIGELNTNIFVMTKLFTECIHEVSKVLLELQLNKLSSNYKF